MPVDHLVPVSGGALTVAAYGAPLGEGPVCVGIHGITASSRSFAAVAGALDGAWTLLAVDLRGRGGSTGLGGPYGMEAHARDVVAVMDHLGVSAAVVAGHSMGAYVATTLSTRHPERMVRVVLIDGGFPLPRPPGVDPDAVIEAVVGPAIERLSMTFPSEAAYFDYWQRHPAVGPYWNEVFEEYFRYDLVGAAPELRSRVEEDAVRADGRELVTDAHVVGALERVEHPMVLIRVNRGLLDEPGGLVPAELAAAAADRIPNLDVHTLDGPNHYTLMMGAGAGVVAAAIGGAAAEPTASG